MMSEISIDNSLSPHGGVLVNNVVENEDEARKMIEVCDATLTIRGRVAKDVINIAYGFFSPLQGFMNRKEVDSVCKKMTLPDGYVWPLPILFDVSKEEISNNKIKKGSKVLLEYHNLPFAILYVDEVYSYNINQMAKDVYGMDMADHPGIKQLHSSKEMFLGGKVSLVNPPIFQEPFNEFFITPQELQAKFTRRRWKRVVAYHTRTVPHVGHEMVMKCGWFMHRAKAVLISCTIGEKRLGECIDETVVLAHDQLSKSGYFRPNTFLTTIFLWDKRFAGPREAILHALVRKNMGCNGHIFGPGHAAVEGFYDKWATHDAFRDLPDLGVDPILVEEWFICQHTGEVAYSGLCGHKQEPQRFSDEGVCSLLSTGVKPVENVLRKEVFDTVIGASDLYGFGDGYVTEEYLQRRNPVFTLKKL